MRAPARLLTTALAAATAIGLVAPTPSAAAQPPARLHTFGDDATLTSFPSTPAPGAIAVAGEFDQEPGGDVIWYTPGPGGDAFWSSDDDGTFTSSPLSINGTYTPYVGGFGGEDKGEDVLWWSATGASQLWDFQEPEDIGGELVKTSLPTVKGAGKVLVGAFDADGVTDVVLYRPGTGADTWWDFQGSDGAPTVTTRSLTVNGTYQPVVASLRPDQATADYGDDILWYAPGSAPDHIWDFAATGGAISSEQIAINGTFTVLASSWTPAMGDDLLFYAKGTAPDALWSFGANGQITKRSLTINGTFTPYACDCIRSGAGDRRDILWHGAGAATDVVWSINGTGFAVTSHTYGGTGIRGSKLALPTLDFAQAVLAYG